MVVASFTACAGDDDAPPGGGGSGGDTTSAGSGGRMPTAGNKSGGEGGVGGSSIGGEGGDAPSFVGDYRVLATFDTDADDVLSWPEQNRLAVGDRGRSVIDVFEVDEAGVERTETFEPDQLLEGAQGIEALAKYGDDFVAVVTNGVNPVQQHVVKVQLGEAPEVLIALPETERVVSMIADPEIGVVVSTPIGLKLAETGATTWKLLADDRRYQPLAFEDNRILVGVEEPLRMVDEGGIGGAGGAGGANGADGSARVQWLDLDGNIVEDHEAFGNPQVAVKDDAGWLIGETNSFWGSYNAGIELLTDDGLQLLTKVAVISSTDGTDGAYDLLRDDDRLLVANCESGLMQSAFSTTKLELEPLEWPSAPHECSPRSIEAVGATIVIGGGGPLRFLRRDQ